MILKLKPILKHRLWGGSYLPKIYDIKTNDTIGEAWILSCIGNDNSPIDNNTTLLDVFKQNPNIVCKGYKGNFPLLIKLIDAQDDLSIQVHPKIKTEFWHVLNDKPSKLYMGFNQNTNRVEVQKELENGNITKMLNHINVSNGDSYLINPGIIHAIGKKTFLIEIQQSADVTYRLYDYSRVDSNGKKRDLHINQALSCINYNQLEISKKNSEQHLVNCPYFNVYKYQIKNELILNATDKSFHSITILDGNGTINIEGKELAFNQYDTFFISAGSGQYKISGQATIIATTL